MFCSIIIMIIKDPLPRNANKLRGKINFENKIKYEKFNKPNGCHFIALKTMN